MKSKLKNINRPFYFTGQVGIDAEKWVNDLSKSRNRPIVDLRPLLSIPVNSGNIPYHNVITNTVRWPKTSELLGPDEVHLGDAFLYLNDANEETMSVQSAVNKAIIDNQVGNYTLPEKVHIIISGKNEEQHMLNHINFKPFRITSCIKNQLVYVKLVEDFNNWGTMVLAAKPKANTCNTFIIIV